MTGEQPSGKSAVGDLYSLLSPYQKLAETKIQESIHLMGNENKLRQACEYALLNGGKRFRPMIVFMIADALGHKADVSHAASAIEFFHCASLVADDLPCMDDDDERRLKPSVHKVYGETIALLASYALIAAGYKGIAGNTHVIKEARYPFSGNSDQIGILALDNAAHNTGFLGATGGQFLDIFPPSLSLSALHEVIHKKTVSLFEISFVLGWLFGGGDPEMLPLVKQGAAYFGTAFQIADDLGDVDQDAQRGRKVNVATVFGATAAVQMFHDKISGYYSALEKLKIKTEELRSLGKWLEEQAEKTKSCDLRL
jgi:geranylgeranyl diphosphate synthase, type II